MPPARSIGPKCSSASTRGKATGSSPAPRPLPPCGGRCQRCGRSASSPATVSCCGCWRRPIAAFCVFAHACSGWRPHGAALMGDRAAAHSSAGAVRRAASGHGGYASFRALHKDRAEASDTRRGRSGTDRRDRGAGGGGERRLLRPHRKAPALLTSGSSLRRGPACASPQCGGWRRRTPGGGLPPDPRARHSGRFPPRPW